MSLFNSSETALSAYILGVALLLCIVYLARAFDMRNLSGWTRRAYGDDAPRVDIFDRPDLAALFTLLTVVALSLAAYIGWRIPAEIERLFGARILQPGLIPGVEMSQMGRVAQVAGAIALGLIALRALRPFIVLAGAAAVAFIGLLAVGYVVG